MVNIVMFACLVWCEQDDDVRFPYPCQFPASCSSPSLLSNHTAVHINKIIIPRIFGNEILCALPCSLWKQARTCYQGLGLKRDDSHRVH